MPKSALRVLHAATIRAEYKRKRDLSEKDDMHARKKKKARRSAASTEERGEEEQGEPARRIQPGESLAHFNRCVLGHHLSLYSGGGAQDPDCLHRRVENDMRAVVRSAVHASSAHGRRVRKREQEETAAAAASPKTKVKDSAASRKAKHRPEDEDEGEDKVPHADRPKEFVTASTSAPRSLHDIALAPPELALKKAAKLRTGNSSKISGVLSMAQRSMMDAEREKAIRRYRELKEKRAQARLLAGEHGSIDR